ncbi:hypothetical protein CDEST_10442 [Colletotrichum destructivum]|uniref:Arrestin n=1 Tax=Colletotrichum destructivum TaxID=34406 RepID=A0AAX4IPG0_9PEZI|nr:hypothetical protein CDEST_10442 [Colletotrichum destructivum]
MADINHHITPLIPAATHAYSAPSPRPPFVDLLFPFLAHKAVGTGWTATHTHQPISTRAYSDICCLPPGAVPRRRPIISADVDVALSMPVSVPVHLINRSKSQVSSTVPVACPDAITEHAEDNPTLALNLSYTAKDNLSPSPRRLRHGLGRVWKQAVLPHPYNSQTAQLHIETPGTHLRPPPFQAWAELDFPKEEPACGQFAPFTFFPPPRTLDFYDT